MGEVLGLGLTHFPPLGWPDETMDRALQFALADPSVPDAVKAGEGWPDGMREEFDRDRVAAAADHRAALVAGCDHVRAALDEFAPDVVVIWGDDQYELFREDVVPAFCVVAADSLTVSPWRGSGGAAIPHVWGEAADTQFELRGHAEFGRHLAASLLHDDFDVAYASATREDRPFPHAVSNTVLFLDYHRVGFPYAVVPMTVNCYGRLADSRRGGWPASRPARASRPWTRRVPHHDGARTWVAPPPGPRPRRISGSRSSRRRAGRTASSTTVVGGCTRTTPPTARSTTRWSIPGTRPGTRRRSRASSSQGSRRC